MGDILTFTTPNTRWLSNMAPVPISFEGITYPSTENFYQAMKYSSHDVRLEISKMTPYAAKKFSRANPMTNGAFEANKLRVMTYAQRKKYAQEPFQQMLLLTGDAHLEEGNWWGDRFWGTDIKTREGENHLGKIIMDVRKDIQNRIQGGVFE